MNKDKLLLLIEVYGNNDIFYNDWIERGYNADILFKKVSKPLRAIRRLWLKNNLFNSSIWYGSWFNKLDKYETVIINMSYLTRYMPFVIAKKYPNLRIICWYWNTIDEKTLPIETGNPNIEYWSFDENDCQKYNMKKNIQYYCAPNSEEKNVIESDIYFVGRSKGRTEIIRNIENIATQQNLKCDFNIADEDGSFIPYKDVRKRLEKTKAVLEINKKDQVGFTLRTLESLFYGIKLITDNKAIKQSSIYNKDNVFIIGEDSFDDLYAFINSPYNHIVDAYRKDYELDTWINNFNYEQ